MSSAIGGHSCRLTVDRWGSVSARRRYCASSHRRVQAGVSEEIVMGFHHVAIATRDLDATHRFYNGVMGFQLAKAVVAPTPSGGWAKHVFYDTGGNGLLA